MALGPGSRLGSFEIVSTLGRGGMGEVYRARDLKLGRDVAIKVLLKEFATDPDRLHRFEQEARAASALNHPNIVHIYDVGELDDTHYIVMELVEGDTLRQLLARAPFSNERLLELGRQIAEGLQKAHRAGIVHRDLKPENVMVTSDGFVKILDFGLAKLLEHPLELTSDMATLARTRHGVLIGTVEYMSPEQAAGKSVDHRADQFALGLILYEMATGQIAFRRDTAAQTLASIIESEPRSIQNLNRRCPAGLSSIVSRCLAKDPEKRYADTGELVRDLKSLDRYEPPPPIPPIPQHPEADGPPVLVLGGVGRYVERQVTGALEEVDRELRQAFGEASFDVQTDSGRVRRMGERRLRKGLRRGRYSGVEMVRRSGDEVWEPLYESRLFREEVPHRGDPARWAAKRKVMEFGQHACVFVSFGVAWFFLRGEVPTWMGFWGVGLAAHAFSTVPAALSLFRRGSLPQARQEALPKPEPDLLSAGFRDEVERVKALLERREHAGDLMKEIDGIVERMMALVGLKRDLEEQTTPEERERLERTEKDAQAKLERAETARDQKLYRRQLEVIRARKDTIEKALAVLDRLKVRQDVAEHQVKQLRLDLSRAEASSASVPELTSRLQDIRHEVDATEDVDEAIAQELLS